MTIDQQGNDSSSGVTREPREARTARVSDATDNSASGGRIDEGDQHPGGRVAPAAKFRTLPLARSMTVQVRALGEALEQRDLGAVEEQVGHVATVHVGLVRRYHQRSLPSSCSATKLRAFQPPQRAVIV